MEDSLEFNAKQVEHIFLYKKFEELCPFFMSIGMSYKEFWEDDPTIAKFYLKSFEIKTKREAQQQKWINWEQGLYTYEALCDVSPIIRAFSKVTKPLPFPSKPLGLDENDDNDNEINNNEKEKKKELELAKVQIFFKNWARATARQFKKGG